MKTAELILSCGCWVVFSSPGHRKYPIRSDRILKFNYIHRKAAKCAKTMNLTATHRIMSHGGGCPVSIIGAAVVTALGDTPQVLWQRIMAGETAIRPVERFPVDGYPAKIAACIENLKSADGRSMLHALLNRLLTGIEPVPSDAVLITATTKAGIDNLELLRRGKSVEFRDVLPNSVSDAVCRKLGLSACGININAACASSTIAVAHGAGLIASGRAEAVLICCADLVSMFFSSSFFSFAASSRSFRASFILS